MYSTNDVSIIIPVYCRTKESLGWFEECLESALKQDCFIKIVSDASPEPVTEIVHDLWDERMSFQRLSEHRGVSFARNRAAGDVHTALQIPLDCDDTFTDDAIERLIGVFDGTPLYPDVCKFGEEDVPHYTLLEFDCDLVYQKVGLASVVVLHTHEQWRTVGGWNEYIDFYEDGEYNARLMISFCGKRYPFPLINYRIHSSQRTRINKGRANQQAKNILATIKEHPGMCCGKARKRSTMLDIASVNQVIRRSPMNLDDVPGTQGDRVLALYVGGKGGGKHYYKGTMTNYPYKVKYGEYYYVDPRDTKIEGDPVGRSLLIRVARDVPAQVEEKKPEVVERTPREAPVVEKTPVEAKEPVFFSKQAEEALPDIQALRWSQEIRHMEFTPAQAKELLKIEKAGKGRVKVIAHLEKYL